ncbi:hypothetical protein CDAR_478901 [Caerostris darwini]|uniref:Uncharacterized protein n=1 Tax=Caerostris darwini TaxID=1538125 RepID=A0AAV4RN21_9ARAC|nr:hypothetical protein CDAR_478901 [Caerostris darwini]
MRYCLRNIYQRAIEPHKCEDIKKLSRLQQKFRPKRNVMRPICEEHPGYHMPPFHILLKTGSDAPNIRANSATPIISFSTSNHPKIGDPFIHHATPTPPSSPSRGNYRHKHSKKVLNMTP